MVADHITTIHFMVIVYIMGAKKSRKIYKKIIWCKRIKKGGGKIATYIYYSKAIIISLIASSTLSVSAIGIRVSEIMLYNMLVPMRYGLPSLAYK